MSDPGRRRALAAFETRSFRFQWPADLLTSWALEMELLILGWYVLTSTGSVFLLTVIGSLHFGGTLLSPWFGTLADRVSRRRLLVTLRAAYAACAAILAGLELTGSLAVWHVFAIALVAGLLRPADLVLRNALVADTVPGEHLANAMGLARTTVDSARIAGALAGAGLFALIGFGPAYAVVAAFHAASAVLTAGVAAGTARVVGSTWSELKLGFLHVRDAPVLWCMMWLAFQVNLTAFPLSHGLLPYVARDVYGVDAIGLGHLSAAYAAGAMAGSLLVAWHGRSTGVARTVVIGTCAWYLLLLVAAHTESKAAGLAVLAGIGLAQSLSMVAMSIALLANTPFEFRGRVMGLRALAIYGLPLGLLAGGALIELIGFRAQTTLYALVGLAATLAISWRWRAELWRKQDFS